MTKVKCRYCKAEIDRDNAYSVVKGQYYCNEEHYKLKQTEKQPKPIKQNYRIVTDYLVEIFGSQSSSYWSTLNRMLKKLSNKGLLYTGMFGTLRYYREVLGKTFNNNPFAIIAIVEDYYNEASEYTQRTQMLNQLGQNFPEDEVKFVTVRTNKKEDKRVIDIEKL